MTTATKEALGRYRLGGVMKPLQGQPVNWNARAMVWSGMDRRYHLRVLVRRLSSLIAGPVGSPTCPFGSRRQRVGYWLRRCIDDRPGRYSPGVLRARRLLNTQADVEAREAWADTNRYWRQREAARVRRAS